jgi:hypothetical protein
MSFDTQTRNRLASFVGKCRTLLCGDFKSPGGEMARQLAHYGIQDTGKFFEVDSLTHLDEPGRETARTLRSILAHKQASAPAAKVWKKFDAAVYDLIQEQGFTVLNRLCALRMAEERKILQFPCISKGLQSDGFELYEYHTGKANAAISKEDRFQHFVFSLFDELSLDLGSLFDRFSPQGLLFPAPQALGELLALINDPALAPLWAEDETIGWIYQYWNSKEERKAMRDASAAPRNSRELAVRNQFFTPRYVVQFLTDNTLGRIWYEMCQGRTGLVDQCEYLVRRPNEVFLGERESAPEVPSDQSSVISEDALTQEDLLKQPVYIPFRPLKDPREIRLLDPACGSMHFGLYAFDLFEKIYSEFWDLTVAEGGKTSSTDHRSLITDHSLQPLPDLYASKEAYMRDVPKMIIEHNIHGIDIDPRAAQIAGLALWLRAQRSWQSAGLLATQRPKVERSNIVCAEPMPGDKEQLGEFTARLHPAIALMVAAIFEKMQLAGEAGSLLKIEEEITSLVNNAKAAWKQIGKSEDEMFSAAEIAKGDLRAGTQTQLDIGSWNLETLSAISDTDFFEQAEQSIYQALARYAESATQGSFKRKLFAQDAAQGFAFIDLCRKRYDAAVMNPPFGEAPDECTGYFSEFFPEWNGNILCATIHRVQDLLSDIGTLGAIFDKTALVKSTYEKFRESRIFGSISAQIMIDLGWGVLDGAQVEAALATWQRGPAAKIALGKVGGTTDISNGEELNALCAATLSWSDNIRGFAFVPSDAIRDFPNQAVPFDVPDWLLSIVSRCGEFRENVAKAMVGCQIKADVNFRLFWEIPSSSRVGIGTTWSALCNGGETSPFAAPIRDVTRFGMAGDAIPFHKSNTLTNIAFQQKPGFGWGKRGDFVDTQVMPPGCVFTIEGQALPFASLEYWPLALLNSKLFWYLMNVFCGQHKYAGYVNVCPVPHASQNFKKEIGELAAELTVLIRSFFYRDETAREYCVFCLNPASSSLALLGSRLLQEVGRASAASESAEQKLNDLIYAWYSLDSAGIKQIEEWARNAPSATGVLAAVTNENSCARELGETAISHALGTVFGRWDIRYATGERLISPTPAPFDPLPVCPPGMLQNESGLPLSVAELTELNAEGSYPLRVSIDGILVDDADHPSEDIAARVGEALAVIWEERSGAIELEACDILKVKELRDYFSEGKSGGRFFKDHLKRYSKSRRKAPIYWPISTESGGYTLWFYYHRLSEDSLYTAVTQFIVPRKEEAAATFARLGAKQERSKAEDKELESAQTLVAELATLKDSLLEIAKFWKPNLNDGVQITAAPLWKHFRLGAWQKDLKDTWSKLQNGEYDWAHLAHSTWPERVIPQCTTDRSLAIAHGHEQALWEEVENAKGKLVWQPKKDAKEIAEELVRQHGK